MIASGTTRSLTVCNTATVSLFKPGASFAPGLRIPQVTRHAFYLSSPPLHPAFALFCRRTQLREKRAVTRIGHIDMGGAKA
ncbi:hypothetical protein AGR4C_Cc80009 [Agrobacterium tumefaciens str. Kerr 14]|uniref:Uncharacterized protein n=1 Tax=Agrobacterium tumefaciens str. Kerr 14 TaxID=1183424 RepID=A0A1S7QGG4_AGRTU|nr:hypothetical protein AGR4C_Cc80009 [Agrobacterium tumefaciens str. Kerr 14]